MQQSSEEFKPTMDLKDSLEILKWQIEMGVDEIIGEERMNHLQATVMATKPVSLELEKETTSKREPSKSLIPEDAPQSKVVNKAKALEDAEQLVSEVSTRQELKEALEAFQHCSFRNTAKNLVFSDGNPQAWLMVLGEAPGRDEDIMGKPFVGVSGKLLDKIFSEAGLARTNTQPQDSIYISNSINWRPPGNRTPTTQEIEMFRPFIWKHIELIKPKILMLTGNIACTAILNKAGITKLRGTWEKIDYMDVMPTVHPAFLLRNPIFKQHIWQDILAIKKKLVDLERDENT